MNQELLNHPYDEDVRAITRPFGVLLRAAVATIDEHGLKRRHLAKHRPEVESFFRGLSAAAFGSEAAEGLRTRLLKYRDKLFTFLDYDGVPWNNNNAEHAIKQFAWYREIANGQFSEQGLKEYLVLLSICQTCRFKGHSFFRFLVSGLQDVDAFCRNKSKRRRFPAAQVYPKGFTPPHILSLHKRRSKYETCHKGAETQMP
jgi:hypothetical protein